MRQPPIRRSMKLVKIPSIGAVVTAFLQNDPQNQSDSYDILTGWKSAVDELVSVGIEEVTFAVYRQVANGNLAGGPAIATVNSAVQYAVNNDLAVTILPLFETEQGWRGNYDPAGLTRDQFQNQYKALITELSQIEGITRFNIGSELNAMVANSDNFGFFGELVGIVENSFSMIGNTAGRIGYAANFDAYTDPQHVALLTHPGIDFMGVSAYNSIFEADEAYLVSETEQVSQTVFDQMVARWNAELEALSDFAATNDLDLLIQEFGAVQQNYAAVAPFATDPGNWVSSSLANRFDHDALEQAALYESLIVATNGRMDEFESITFWTWEHQASRGRRTFENLGTTGVIEKFAIWPTDGGAGQYLTQFLGTRQSAEVTLNGTSSDDIIDVIESDLIVTVVINGVASEFESDSIEQLTVLAGRRK